MKSKIFGSIQWEKPQWLQSILGCCQCGRWWPISQRGRLSLLAVLMVSLIAGSAYAYWILKKPKDYAYVHISLPASADIDTLDPDRANQPRTLTLSFTARPEKKVESWTKMRSVAPLEKIGKEVAQGITMTPKVSGQWRWQSESALQFIPTHPWPAGNEYQVSIDDTLLANQIALKKRTYPFNTQPLEARIKRFTFDLDLKKPNRKQLAATLEFNYPVSVKALQEHLKLRWLGAQTGIDYQLRFGPYQRRAYLLAKIKLPPQDPRFAELILTKGLASTVSGKETEAVSRHEVKVPSLRSYLTVDNLSFQTPLDLEGNGKQLVALATNLGVTRDELAKHLELYLLTERDSRELLSRGLYEVNRYQNQNQLTDRLQRARRLSLHLLPTEHPFSTLHGMEVSVPKQQVLVVKLTQGLKANGGFILADDVVQLLETRPLPTQISFVHQGAIVAQNSVQKIALSSTGIRNLRVQVDRIIPEQLNQLISQTHGDLNNPEFNNYNFDARNIAQSSSFIESLQPKTLDKSHDFSLDLPHFDKKTKPSLGLYWIRLQNWDPKTDRPLPGKTQRLILVSDFGLYLKKNADNTQDLFVYSIVTGKPVAEAKVALLGSNGLPMSEGMTNSQGYWHLNNIAKLSEQTGQQPLAVTVRHQGDMSFLPFSRAERRLNLSRFSIGGSYFDPDEIQELDGYLFTDRGLYRSGETLKIAALVKSKGDWLQPQKPLDLGRLPLTVQIYDPAFKRVFTQRLTLDEGYLATSWQLPAATDSGTYHAYLYISNTNIQIAKRSFQVGQFEPDTLKLSLTLNQQHPKGWVSPQDLKAMIQLDNLYGLPASGNRLKADLTLQPGHLILADYPSYSFTDPLAQKNNTLKPLEYQLPEQRTDQAGKAIFDLNNPEYGNATYSLSLYVQALNRGGGHGVEMIKRVLVSPLKALVGVDSLGSLDNLAKGAKQAIKLIAVNSKGASIDLPSLTLALYRIESISVLVKQANGTYSYESKSRARLLSQQPFAIKTGGVLFNLPTQEAGNFELRLTNTTHQVVSKQKFNVAGAANYTPTKNSYLKLSLDRADYAPGSQLQLKINTPYAGTGLITIERDKVFAYRWFHTQGTFSQQRIRLPEALRGNAYVSVNFARDYNSPEQYSNPLSYAVAPFKVSHEAQRLNIELQAPAKHLPGEPLKVRYRANQKGNIIVYAVDRGILQVANYQLPDPLGYFYRKRALQVNTLQNIDLIMPRYQQHRLSSSGGGQAEALVQHRINPFKQQQAQPMVFWSGIVPVTTQFQQLSIPVPESFNGDLRIMAVAANSQMMGSQAIDSHIQAHFILQPNNPSFVAPGDIFDLSVALTDNRQIDAGDGPISLKLETSPYFTLIGENPVHLKMAHGAQQMVHFRLKANNTLGDAKLRLVASDGERKSGLDFSITVRPQTLYRQHIRSGFAEQQVELPLDVQLYANYRTLSVSASNNPRLLLHALQVKDEPLKGLYRLFMLAGEKATNGQAILGSKFFLSSGGKATAGQAVLNGKLNDLRNWQLNDGGFSIPELRGTIDQATLSLQLMNLLQQLDQRDYLLPTELYQSGLRYIHQLAYKQQLTDSDLDHTGQAIFLLARAGQLPTGAIDRLQNYLSHQPNRDWQGQLVTLYLAATYKLMLNDKLANQWLGDYLAKTTTQQWPAVNLLADQFPNRLGDYLSPKDFDRLLDQFVPSEASLAQKIDYIMGLEAYGRALGQRQNEQNLTLLGAKEDGAFGVLQQGSVIDEKRLSPKLKMLKLSQTHGAGFYYVFNTSGFSPQIAKQSVQHGIEIYAELSDSQDQPLKQLKLGQLATVTLRLRNISSKKSMPVVVTYLLPAGTQVDRASLSLAGATRFVEQDDRVLFYLSLNDDQQHRLQFRLTGVALGDFAVPAAQVQYVEAPNYLFGQGKASRLQITK